MVGSLGRSHRVPPLARQTAMTETACHHWGHTSAPQTARTNCECHMCKRHRHTLANLGKKKKR